MTPLDRALRRVLADLSEMGVDFALVGGLAVTVRGHERLTRDVDLAVAVSRDDQAESLIHALIGRGYSLESLLEHVASGRIATARLNAPPQTRTPTLIDLLFASTGIEQEIVKRAEEMEVRSGVTVKVARLADLIAMKVLSRDVRKRPQDQGDLFALVREASPGDLRAARDALRLIEARGFHRRRRLLVDLKRILSLSTEGTGTFRGRPLSKPEEVRRRTAATKGPVRGKTLRRKKPR